MVKPMKSSNHDVWQMAAAAENDSQWCIRRKQALSKTRHGKITRACRCAGAHYASARQRIKRRGIGTRIKRARRRARHQARQ